MDPNIEVVGEAKNGREVILEALRLQPDVILMDLVMPEIDGIEAISSITAEQPEIRILVLTSFAGDDNVFPALKAGAVGYLLKDTSPEQLLQAIQQVHNGESSIHPTIARMLLQELTPSPVKTEESDHLTKREMDVLKGVAQGRSNLEISSELYISEATVRTHVSNMLSKLHLTSRTQAALYALRRGFASLDDNGDFQESS